VQYGEAGVTISAAQATQTITFVLLPSTVVFGTPPVTLSATATSGLHVIFSVLSGPATVIGTTLTFTGSGTVVVAADQAGNSSYQAAPEVTQTVIVLPQSYTSPTQQIGTSSGVQTAAILLSKNFTLGSISVVTQGAPNLDFTYASGGTCAIGTVYTAGQVCTANYTFAPRVPGQRMGAILLKDGNGSGETTEYISGIGTGPLGVLTPGIITTIAGNGTKGYTGDDGPATTAELSYPTSVALDGAGDLYIADEQNSVIRRIDVKGIITTVAGNGSTTFSGDNGPALAAGIGFPNGIALDGAGNLFIAEELSGQAAGIVRKVDSNGIITTIAGTGNFGYSGDNGPAINANLYPDSLVVDRQGDLYISDSESCVVRKVDTNNIISTVAGTGLRCNDSGDNGPAISATLANPAGLAFDANGNLYIADPGRNGTTGNVVRKVDTNGIITT